MTGLTIDGGQDDEEVFFAMLTVAAALCGCSGDELLTDVVPSTGEGEKNENVETMVFTATMEGAPGAAMAKSAPETRAIFDETYKCASWEVDDPISVNGTIFKAESAGTSTTFREVAIESKEIRPAFVSSTNTGSYQNQPAQNLVDDAGTSTRWIANKTDMDDDGVWNIVVTTGNATLLNSIKLWNAANSSYPGRRWKSMKVYGSATASGSWTEIKSIQNLDLAINNQDLAGEIAINATEGYTYYRIDVLDNEGDKDGYMQMSDMKFVVTPPSVTSPYEAFFPSNLYDGTTAVLPSAVTETWADGKFNMPMYAQSEDNALQFKNLCGVLKIIVKSDRMSAVKGIRVSSANKAVSGAFTVNSDNAAVLTNPDNTANTLTVTYTEAVPTTEEGTVFYVAIPAQAYRQLKIELSSDGATFPKSMTTRADADIVVARNKIYPLNHTGVIPSGAIPFEFTVNAEGKKVYFSKGNLQATFIGPGANNYSWGFAEHQYDRIRNNAGNTTIDNQEVGAVVDLFGWSTPSTYYGISTSENYEDYSGDFRDWGTVIDDNGTWRTLTKDEWDYLLFQRAASTVRGTENARFVRARIKTGYEDYPTPGIILFPDEYTHPSVPKFGGINDDSRSDFPPDFESRYWQEMEAAGCVFLPYGWFREGSWFGLSAAFYWSSTKYDDSYYDSYAYYFYSSEQGVRISAANKIFCGHSVRLVTDVK